MTGGPSWSVFTKPWPRLTAAELVAKAAELGFDGVELPVRDGFQVAPGDAERELPALAARFADAGLRIDSVAGSLEERVFAACAAAGVPLLRVMAPIVGDDYLAAEREARRGLAAALPWSERYGVRIGVQQHQGAFVSDSLGLRRLLDALPAAQVGAVWDAGHDALTGRAPEVGLGLVEERLLMVNLKNAFLRRAGGPEVPAAWAPHWTTGPHGVASWPRVARWLRDRPYGGTVCLTAQYTAADRVEELVAADLRWARSLFADLPGAARV